MKPRHHHGLQRPQSAAQERGMALVLSLVVILMLTIMAVIILFTSRTERQSSSLFSGSIEARLLAETSVNICIAQIRDATNQPLQAWVSQPGMIRTYSGSRDPATNYRLYSWADMRVTGPYDPFSQANAVPENWQEQPALFVDLNEPAPDPASPRDPMRDHYPILYPPAMAAHSHSSTNGGELTNDAVAGYRIDPNHVGATENLAPMPVQWLYMLADGTVHSGTPVPGEPDQVEITAATADNPIRGRIAFWADDETSKININTAAGGAYWTEPRFQTNPDEHNNGTGYGFTQPVLGEYQRYPGHPARTDLRAAFPELGVQALYELAPRIRHGGSQDATEVLANTIIRPDTDRLYSTIGELRFASTKATPTSNRPNLAGNNLLFAPLNNADVWTRLIERRKGVLTASSRAPELTLFGTPRIAVWPIDARTGTAPSNRPYRTAIDKLIAFCSTIKTTSAGVEQHYPYYFTREDPYSPTHDIDLPRNQQLLGYLQRLTNAPFPGVSNVALSTKYGGPQGRDQLLTQIFDYIRIINLQDLMSNQPYSADALVVPSSSDLGNGATTGFGRSFQIHQAGLLFICNADADLPESNHPPGEPNPPPGTQFNLALDTFQNGGKLNRGQRRVQALFLFELFSPAAGFKSIVAYPYVRVKGLDSITVNGIPLAFPADAQATRPNVYPGSYPGGFGSNGGVVNFRWAFQQNHGSGSADRSYDVVSVGAMEGAANGYPLISVPVTIEAQVDANGNWEDRPMTISGGTLEVEIYRDAAQTQLLGKAQIPLGTVTVAPPKLHPGYQTGTSVANGHPGGSTNAVTSNDLPNNPKEQFWAFPKSGIFGNGTTAGGTPGRFGRPSNSVQPKTSQAQGIAARRPYHDSTGLFTWYDTVVSWIVPHGDYRLLYGPKDEFKSFSAASAGEFSHLRHHFRDILVHNIGANTLATFAPALNPAEGQALSAIPMRPFWAPTMEPQATYPPGVTPPWQYGDWDTGTPMVVPDGPLINKVDEGSLYRANNGENPYMLEVARTSESPMGLRYHSPSRQIPSAVMFGSLSTGLIEGKPWQTLLFRPVEEAVSHPGAQDPPDHFLLDLFWMPVVEPYAISEPFSTAGKVNMNYQMVPFTWIERSTAMHALLRGEKLLAVPDEEWSGTHRDHFNTGYARKSGGATQVNPLFKMALDIDINQTLAPFRDRFSTGGLFLAPSEITTLPLIPEGSTQETIKAFWERHRLTGENLKERPYAHLYPRLTTRSNVFNVHYRVQTLRRPTNLPPNRWDERRGAVVTELRGNTLIERYIDPNQSGIPDYASTYDPLVPNSPNAESLYGFRILSTKEFNP